MHTYRNIRTLHSSIYAQNTHITRVCAVYTPQARPHVERSSYTNTTPEAFGYAYSGSLTSHLEERHNYSRRTCTVYSVNALTLQRRTANKTRMNVYTG